MERGDRTRFPRVEEGVHRRWDTSIPGLWDGDTFILTTDWSKENIVGVLSQVQERFLGCCGRNCNKYERNYST